MKYRIFLLVCLICTVALTNIPVSGEYMGGGIQLGGSGSRVTRVTTAATTGATTAALPLATLPAAGSLTVATSPIGATIFIDGVQRGISPATIPGLSPGRHTLSLKLDGYEDLSAPVTVIAGQTSTYTLDLTPTAAEETTLPAPAKKKAPGFEALPGIAALGIMVLVPRSFR